MACLSRILSGKKGRGLRAKSQPSRIDEVVRLAYAKVDHPKVLAMIDAYLDESGIYTVPAE
jgi:hypothetical protein